MTSQSRYRRTASDSRDSRDSRNSRYWRRWWPLLLPGAYLLHLAEEWWGGEGFARWTADAYGAPVSTTRFLILNGIVWPLFAGLTIAAIRRPSLAWFLTTFSTIVVVNGVLHVLGSLATSSCSPGLLTSLFLYFPIGTYALLSGSRELPSRAFGLAVLGGALFHALVAVIAFA